MPPGVDNFILDSELVAIDEESEKLLPFQTLSSRSRKHVTAEDLKNKVAIYAFDLLFLNGEPLIRKTLFERRHDLRETFQEVPGKFYFAQAQNIEDTEEL